MSLLWVSSRAANRGLLFPPGSRAVYETLEFRSEVRINSLGFRDREIIVDKPDGARVLLVGDSTTFGWGVRLEESWGKLLEKQLRARGVAVEILNLGKPGASPRDYADLAERAVPWLKPDLVVVAILQGDDLAQLREPPARPSWWRALWPRAGSIGEEWRNTARELFAIWVPAERARFQKLPPRLRAAFHAGTLNPWVLHRAVTYPTYYTYGWDPAAPETKPLIARLAEQLTRIKGTAPTLVATIPVGGYTSRRQYDLQRRLGLTLFPQMLTGEGPDEVIRRAARASGLEVITATDAFRRHGETPPLFYDYDGHFTVEGNRLYAEAVAAAIAAALRSRHPNPGDGRHTSRDAPPPT
jgi:hypothetical protein